MNRQPISRGLLLVAFAVVATQVASGQANKQRGATVGGLIGAAVGGLIGDNNGEAGAGAAIGGVVGAVAGGTLGDAADKEQAYRQQQRYYQQQQARTVQRQTAVSMADVASMVRSGLSEQVILNQIQIRGVQRTLQVPDIIALHQQGVPESVITAMQHASVGPPAPATPTQSVAPIHRVAPAPVIVEEHYYVPHYPVPRYHYRRPTRYPYRSGFHFRIGL